MAEKDKELDNSERKDVQHRIDIDNAERRRRDGKLQLKAKFVVNDEHAWVPFDIIKADYPAIVARYLLENKVDNPTGGSKYRTGRYSRWARTFLRQLRRTIRRMHRLYGHRTYVRLDDGDSIFASEQRSSRTARRHTNNVRRPTKRKKKGVNDRIKQTTIKYGIKVPRNVREALTLDRINRNKKWEEAMEREIGTLIDLGCFAFHPPNYKPGRDYQFAPLRMIFDVKHDFRHKARLVVGGHVVENRGAATYASVVKTTSVRILDVIAHRDGLEQLCGDVGNAFVNASTKEKVYCRAGEEFGDRHGSIVVIKKALYGLASSANMWRNLFADFLRGLGFAPSRCDRDVWLRLRDDDTGYDYICTHVDDFKILAKDPRHWMDQLKASFVIKADGPPSYYLGCDYFRPDPTEEEPNPPWQIGCQTYIKEAIGKLETIFGTIAKNRQPIPTGCHPETDESPLLNDKEHRNFQMVLGMAQWISLISRLDIAHAVASLSRFNAAPREYHFRLALQIFGYLKQYPNQRLSMDSRPLFINDEVEFIEGNLDSQYPDAAEEIDDNLPPARGEELATTIWCDSDHAHDKKTRRSITGIIVCLGRTPIHWISKRQGAIASSTYQAEFSAMRTAVEESVALRYTLRCFGVPVTKPTMLLGDNLGVVQSACIEEALLKAIAYHTVREAVAANCCLPCKIPGKENVADILTKQLPATEHIGHVHEMTTNGQV